LPKTNFTIPTFTIPTTLKMDPPGNPQDQGDLFEICGRQDWELGVLRQMIADL